MSEINNKETENISQYLRPRKDEFKDIVKGGLPISVDFDATLCKPHAYPHIIAENTPCFDVLHKWQNMGCMILLSTMHGGKELTDALDWCRERGFEFDGVNRNPTQDEWCRPGVFKIYSILDIDDRNAGSPLQGEAYDGRGWVDWNEIDRIYTPKIKEWLSLT